MSLCRFKDVLGKPGQGAHSYRFCNIAIIDVVLTFALAKVIELQSKDINFKQASIISFALGIISHRVFCVKTTVDKLLFGK